MTSDDVKKMLRRAADTIKERHKNSVIFDEECEKNVPCFDFSELVLGKVLGRGGFCVVNEISRINLLNGASSNGDPNDMASRSFISSHVIRDGDARYAIKKLSKDVINDKHRYVQGTVDLAIEARFLAVISHPNIIKMRGKASGDPFGSDYFLILDRLYGTLDVKIGEWKKKMSKLNGVLGSVRPGKKKTKLVELSTDRLLVCYDLASAMRYMHNLSIIYRDLKPDNIGFDIRGDVKIFDLGLAKELNPNDMVDGNYKLTGNTGSLRYMAPEIAKAEPYNFSADIYSFGIIFWQICSLSTPYSGYSCKMHADLVVKKGYRPKPNEAGWPIGWVQLCRNCWTGRASERPTFEEVCEILGEEIAELRGDDEGRALDRSSRSAHSM